MSDPEVTTDVDAAAAVLRSGGLVGLPTETVYGLAALATDADAVRRVFAAKGRPADHPLIVHLPDASHLDRWAAEVPDSCRRLVDALWPGPLTVVLQAGPSVLPEVTGGRPTVALRVPDHPVALAVLRLVDDGLAAPSANRFGAVSPTRPEHVVADLGDACDLVLDGGPCDVGVESTIVDLSGPHPEVLRAGAITAVQIEALLGEPVAAPAAASGAAADGEPVRAPGMLAAHYAPRATVVAVDTPETAGTAVAAVHTGGSDAGVGPVGVMAPTTDALDRCVSALGGAGFSNVVELEPVGDPDGYARVLYDRMRQADRLGCAVVVAVLPSPHGVGLAVGDRLRRASVGSGGSHPSD